MTRSGHVGERPASSAGSDPLALSENSDPPRWATEGVANAIALLGFCCALALYFWFIHQYGVNAIYVDQWDNIALLTHSSFFQNSYMGHMSLTHLWAQHNESRMLFPNLVVLLLGTTTHMNVVV